jgi:hypothetical protein
MSTASLAAAPGARRGSPLPVWVVLGTIEVRRLVRHPVFLGCLAFMAITAGVDLRPGPREAYSVTTGVASFFLGPFTFFAANLLASRDRRHRTEEWLSALPARRQQRTGAALLACFGPAAVATLLMLVAYVGFSAAGIFVRDPHPLELLSAPLCVLGGGLLGVMVARWAPWPGAAALVMVALVVVHVSLGERLRLLGAYVEFARYAPTSLSDWAGVIDGSRGWHVVYLVALCAMAATGALLVDARRRLPVLAVGGALTACAVVAGWAQLP